jgi:AbrB family looped-hinge helix DNA binding protein
MAKVTAKLQVTVPKSIADQFGIRPGDEIEWEPAGDAIRVIPAGQRETVDTAGRLKLFDDATRRQREREARRGVAETVQDRGWKREDLYERGSSR